MDLRSSLRMEGFSIRSIFTFVIVVVVTAFLWIILGSSTPVNAAEASWNGAALTYDGKQFNKIGEAQEGESHGLAKGTIYYQVTERVDETRDSRFKAHVIYFAPGADPPTATTASYVTYDFNVSTKAYSNPSSVETVEINREGSTETTSSCDIDGTGWIVCPVSNFLARGMDLIFEMLSGFMEVQPINVGNSQSDLFVAWNIMRNIANVAFIIVFIIIIYSQMTSVGLSNYGLKKILPRLIVGAILVNLSFIICAVAVDISNILGYSLQDVFMQIRNGIFHIDSNTWSDSVASWEDLTAFVLSGGTAALAGGIAVSTAIASSGSVIGLIYLILPALVALLLTVLVVLVVLAARQAIIIIFIIIAPLAFVAYLLPNTEKWFNKWREVFMTMLIFFPAFSVVFGGSQLAGAVIIQNASSLNVIVLGMIVQVAPLVITPLLIKFSGNLLGKIAGMINDPSKGLLDRTRKWSDANREHHRLRAVANIRRNGTQRKRSLSPIRNHARAYDMRRRRLETKTKIAGTAAENTYHASKRYSKLHENEFSAEQDKERINEENTRHIHDQVNNPNSRLHATYMNAQAAKHASDVAKTRTTRITEEYKAGHTSSSSIKMAEVASRMAVDTTQLMAETRATVAAKQTQQQTYAAALEANDPIIKVAAGIDPRGEQRALAEAIAIISKNKKENIENIETIINYKDLSDAARMELARGNDTDGIKATAESKAAAIQSLFKSASPATIGKLIKEFDTSDMPEDDQKMLNSVYADAISSSKFRPAFYDYSRIAKNKQGLDVDINGEEVPFEQRGEDGVRDMILNVISKRTLSVSALQDTFTPDVMEILKAVEYVDTNGIDSIPGINDETKAKLADGLSVLRQRVEKVLDPNREGYEKLGDSEMEYKKIKEVLDRLTPRL